MFWSFSFGFFCVLVLTFSVLGYSSLSGSSVHCPAIKAARNWKLALGLFYFGYKFSFLYEIFWFGFQLWVGGSRKCGKLKAMTFFWLVSFGFKFSHFWVSGFCSWWVSALGEMGGHKSCGKWKSFQRKTSKDLNGFYKVRIESKVLVAKKAKHQQNIQVTFSKYISRIKLF